MLKPVMSSHFILLLGGWVRKKFIILLSSDALKLLVSFIPPHPHSGTTSQSNAKTIIRPPRSRKLYGFTWLIAVKYLQKALFVLHFHLFPLLQNLGNRTKIYYQRMCYVRCKVHVDAVYIRSELLRFPQEVQPRASGKKEPKNLSKSFSARFHLFQVFSTIFLISETKDEKFAQPQHASDVRSKFY